MLNIENEFRQPLSIDEAPEGKQYSEIFGSGILVQGMGFLLHDRGAAFTLDADHPNALAARKRPYHTIIPAFMEQGSRHIAFGIMRGVNQPQAQMQFVTNIADHKMNIQAALEAPRFTKPTLGGCELLIEARVPEIIRAQLEQKGHRLEVLGDFSGLMGGGQAVLHDSAAQGELRRFFPAQGRRGDSRARSILQVTLAQGCGSALGVSGWI